MQKLGIDLVQLAAQLINIVILIFVLKKFLYRPVLKILDQRRESIERGLSLEKQLEEKLKQVEEKEQERSRQARLEVNKQLKTAEKEAKTVANELISQARKSAEKIRKQTREEAKQELAAQQANYETELVKRATNLANEALVKLLDKKTRFRLTEAQIKSVAKIK